MSDALLSRFVRDRKANIAVITALVMIPIIFLLGMTLDFTQALRKKQQLDAAADAAAIAAVRPAMLMQTDAVAQKHCLCDLHVDGEPAGVRVGDGADADHYDH